MADFFTAFRCNLAVYKHLSLRKKIFHIGALVNQPCQLQYLLQLDKFCMNLHLVHIVLLLLHP